MITKLTSVATQEISDAARTLVKLASDLTVSAKRVSVWAKSPTADDLMIISADIGEKTQALQNAIDAHMEADRPSLANIEWRCQVAKDRATRAWDKFQGEFHEWHTPEWHAAEEENTHAYQEYLQARRELRSHPDWKPKHPKKSKVGAIAALKKPAGR